MDSNDNFTSTTIFCSQQNFEVQNTTNADSLSLEQNTTVESQISQCWQEETTMKRQFSALPNNYNSMNQLNSATEKG